MTVANLQTRIRTAFANVRAAGHTSPVTGEQDAADKLGTAIFNEAGSGVQGDTGDIKMTIRASQTGWLLCNGDTIGNAASGADHADADLEDLFNFVKAVAPNAGSEIFGNGDTVALPDMRGLYPVGMPAGGTLGGGAGTPLTDEENRAVGQHLHAVTDGGHTHGAIQGNSPGTGTSFTPNNTFFGVNAFTESASTGLTVDNEGAVAGTNAPYLQFNFIVKI